jgi:hypothetical protein
MNKACGYNRMYLYLPIWNPHELEFHGIYTTHWQVYTWHMKHKSICQVYTWYILFVNWYQPGIY